MLTRRRLLGLASTASAALLLPNCGGFSGSNNSQSKGNGPYGPPPRTDSGTPNSGTPDVYGPARTPSPYTTSTNRTIDPYQTSYYPYQVSHYSTWHPWNSYNHYQSEQYYKSHERTWIAEARASLRQRFGAQLDQPAFERLTNRKS